MSVFDNVVTVQGTGPIEGALQMKDIRQWRILVADIKGHN